MEGAYELTRTELDLGPTVRAGETYTLDPQMSEADALAYWLASEKETFVAEEDGAHVCNGSYMRVR